MYTDALKNTDWYKAFDTETELNVNPWYWVTDNTKEFMAKGYLTGQSVQERVVEICETFCTTLLNMGMSIEDAKSNTNLLYHYVSWGWVSFATPVWVAYGNERGLPISCFNSDVEDSMDRILYASSEIGMLTKLGGGTSVYLGKLRPRGAPIRGNGESDGAAHFAKLYNAMMQITRQGSRRGYCAAYLEADHKDILEFLDIGTDISEVQNITTGVNLSDSFMQKGLDGDVNAQTVLAKVNETRGTIGYPYILFTDNANKQKPQVYKDKHYPILSSNLCNEIMLPSSDDESFVCVLSSLNLVHFDTWKHTSLVRVMTTFLDTVIEESIQKLKVMRSKTNQSSWFLQRIVNFLTNHRAIGLGVVGLHHLFQSKMIAFESKEAAKLNLKVFKYINEESLQQSRELAIIFGEPAVLKGYGQRFTTRIAIAPTKSSASILGNVSESIQPELANLYIAELAKTTQLIKNPYLEDLLESKGKNTKEVWKQIEDAAGSVQGLVYLTEEEKAVFKTFAEIAPRVIIDLAATRQTYIDQGQSLNLIFHPDVSAAEINALLYYAWKMGIKGLYYQFSMNAAQAMNVSKMSNKECLACGG